MTVYLTSSSLLLCLCGQLPLLVCQDSYQLEFWGYFDPSSLIHPLVQPLVWEGTKCRCQPISLLATTYIIMVISSNTEFCLICKQYPSNFFLVSLYLISGKCESNPRLTSSNTFVFLATLRLHCKSTHGVFLMYWSFYRVVIFYLMSTYARIILNLPLK